MKINKKVTFGLCAVMCLSVVLSGCGKKEPISLEQAMKNTQEVKSGTTSMSISVSSENKELGMPVNVQMGFTGDFQNESKTKGKMSGDITINMEDMGMQFAIPVKANVNSPEEVEMFIGIPAMYQQMLGIEEGKEFAYLNTKEMKEMQEEKIAEAEDTKKSEEFDMKAYENLNKKFYERLNAFKTENEGVLVFSEIEKKAINENGIYTINFSKEQSKEFIISLLKDETFVAELEKATGMPIVEDKEIAEDTEEGIKSNIDELIAEIEKVSLFDMSGKIVIEDKIMKSIEFNFIYGEEDDKAEMSMKVEYSNINKEVNIEMPNKEDDNVFDLNKLMKELESLQTFDLDIDESNPYPTNEIGIEAFEEIEELEVEKNN